MHFEADETSSPENGEHFDQPNWGTGSFTVVSGVFS